MNTFYASGLNRLIVYYDRCPNLEEDYAEK
jgi:hypothetical protein